MAQSKEERNQIANSLMWGMPLVMNTPIMVILGEVNGAVLESFATAQKEWADLVLRLSRRT